jgi:hypothetical protein
MIVMAHVRDRVAVAVLGYQALEIRVAALAEETGD